MKKLTLALSALLATCTAQAAAQESPPPNISEVPLESDESIRSGVNSPSDLPAPETTSWINKPLLITSTALLAASYVPALVISQTSERPIDQDKLRYPVVGPWMDLMDRGCDDRACPSENTNKTLLIVDGVAQGVGALGVVLSLLLPGKTTQHWYLIGQTHVGPMYVTNSVLGLGAAGSF